MLELAEDRFEGGERPLAKSRRAAAAASAARAVEWCAICVSAFLPLLEPMPEVSAEAIHGAP